MVVSTLNLVWLSFLWESNQVCCLSVFLELFSSFSVWLSKPIPMGMGFSKLYIFPFSVMLLKLNNMVYIYSINFMMLNDNICHIFKHVFV